MRKNGQMNGQMRRIDIDLHPYVLEDMRKGTSIKDERNWRYDFKNVVAQSSSVTAKIYKAFDSSKPGSAGLITIAIFKDKDGKELGYVRGDRALRTIENEEDLFSVLKPM